VHVILFSSHFSFFFFLSSNMCLQGEKTHVHDETSVRARTQCCMENEEAQYHCNFTTQHCWKPFK
jgi:hypothetical protein